MLPPKWDDFANPNDAWCNRLLWFLLVLAFAGYTFLLLLMAMTMVLVLVMTMTMTMVLVLVPELVLLLGAAAAAAAVVVAAVYDVEVQLPPVWMRLCELTSFSLALNYSLLDHLIAPRSATSAKH
ncbi:hypothetical protein AK812_SmicGene18128 [Symbiodinium microadriaticum]|uniref:Uncharacterized protein n=1 Tax=Symbiodinium microadriaticum TaxID=2951 RepID=A0A1Q9DVZ3_SYMMI|nr:hypothetical protein AK812_SmicGene18128 [Symbiodinium microadriaticum]